MSSRGRTRLVLREDARARLDDLKRAAWPAATDLRIGLGCMRLSTDEKRDEELALETIAAAAESGVAVFDTAHAYGRDGSELGHNERLLARGLRACGAADRARVVTKGGMTRPGGAWVPDGRAKAIRADCEASMGALDGLPIDLYLLHAPDPRTPWPTSVRALARLVEDGLVRQVGIANVNRKQLDEALELAPVAVVQVPLSVFDDRALRGGVVERCLELGIALVAHSPLGGPRRAPSLARRPELTGIARARGATAAEIALAWLLGLGAAVVAIPGARRPETARSAARAATLDLDAGERALIEQAFGIARPSRARRVRRRLADAEVLLVMGIPGAGKSRLAHERTSRGYVRLNRDERGGTLRELAGALDELLVSGVRRAVLDNTYLTRASRSHVLEVAGRHGVPVRCIWLDTPLAQAQVNVVERVLERVGSLPSPEELRALARREPGVVTPTSQMRALRELEPPNEDEGFASIERVTTARGSSSGSAGLFVAAAALDRRGWEEPARSEPDAPCLVFDWRPSRTDDALAPAVERVAAVRSGPVAGAVCPHGDGPPVCWCRPPLPGLPLAFARTHGLDPARSRLVGASPAHGTLATALGSRFVRV